MKWLNKNIAGINITIIPFNEVLREIIRAGKDRLQGYACFANSHMTVEANKSEEFQKVVNGATFTLADGVPLQKSLRWLHGIHQERIAGMDFMPALLREAEINDVSIYFYGSTPAVLERMKGRASVEYPNLKIVGMHSPPFRILTKEEEESEIQEIKKSGAGIVLVALGCPKQEKWVASNFRKIDAMMLGVGAAFPVFARTQSMAPAWMRKNGLEWFYRFLQEPHRLFKRYFFTNSYFLWLIIKQWITQKYS